MAPWLIPTLVAGAQMGFSLLSGAAQKREAKRRSRAEADAFYSSAQEELRRLKTQQDANLGNITATMGASGLSRAGSAGAYERWAQLEQGRQYDWQSKTNEANRRAILAGGSAQGSAMQRASNIQGLNAGIGTLYGYYQSQQMPASGGLK